MNHTALNCGYRYESEHEHMIISYISEFFCQVNCELMMACSPVGLLRSMDRVLHPVITKFRVGFLVKPEFSKSLLHVYMTEHVYSTVYKLIWFTKTKLLAISQSHINVRLNCILNTHPSPAQIKNISFPGNFHDLK